ncbi:MAG: hypothetical protein C0501_07060 [Isosphaera sp.]|nr:hypothetical protein [Isosphaera sp.]
MRHSLVAGAAGVTGLAVGLLIGRPGRPGPDIARPDPPAGPATAPPPREVVERRTFIPLGEVYSTSFQRELAGAPPAEDDRLREVFEDIKRAARDTGTSNAFVLWADTPRELVSYTRHALRNGYPPEAGGRRDVPPGTPLNLWLVVTLRPSRWRVEAVESYGSRVRFRYSRPESLFATGDLHPYVYWCRLPEAHHDVYRVELFDEGEGEVVLTRRVRVRRPVEPDPVVVDPDSAK